MPVFVHALGIKTVQEREEGIKKWQNSVHVVVECPLPPALGIISKRLFRILKIP